jgi:cytochrome c-type biogenesis protein CcmE
MDVTPADVTPGKVVPAGMVDDAGADAPADTQAAAADPTLAPRVLTDLSKPAAPRRKSTGPKVLLALVVVAAGFLVWQFLSSASLYFCNADEVGKRSECKVDHRFRLQGTVDKGSVTSGTPLQFTVSYNGVTVPVTYQNGQPGGIFREDIPVVVEGRMNGGVFYGDNILVKHSAKYVAENPDRVKDYPQK